MNETSMFLKVVFGLDWRRVLLWRGWPRKGSARCVTFADKAPSLAVVACISDVSEG